MIMDVPAEADIAIVGGGLVGSSLALMLAAQGRQVALVEARAPGFGDAQWDERCIALNAASRIIFERMGLWADLQGDAEPLLSTHISERGRFGQTRFDARELNLPALGYNTPMRAINHLLWKQASQNQGIALICPAQLVQLDLGSDCITLRLQCDGGDVRQIKAKLVVAADGANSRVRALLGVPTQTRDYRQTAVVTAVETARAHQGLAYERFLPTGPLALVPKPSAAPAGACSLIWTVPSSDSARCLALSDADFLAESQRQFGERLGRFQRLGRRLGFPLHRLVAESITAPRVALAGNAAQSLHPVAAQGFNLGLRDAAALARVICGADDPGAPAVVEQYRQVRQPDRQRVAGFTDQLVGLFSNRIPGLRGLRHLGLLALDLDSPLRDAVLRQNLGMDGITATAD